MSTIRTRSGRDFDLIKATAEDVDLHDVARSLAMICRFNGHTRRHYSVAEHSMNVARLLPEPIKIYGLLHDAHEAYIGDITTPVKEALALVSDEEVINQGFEEPELVGIFETALRDVERPILAAIHKRCGVSWPPHPDIAAAVKYADVTMVHHELRQLFPGPHEAPAGLPMPAWDVPEAEPEDIDRMFLNELRSARRN